MESWTVSQSMFLVVGLPLVAFLLVLMLVVRRVRKFLHEKKMQVALGSNGIKLTRGIYTIVVAWPWTGTELKWSMKPIAVEVAPRKYLRTYDGRPVSVKVIAELQAQPDHESLEASLEELSAKEPAEQQRVIQAIIEGHLENAVGQFVHEKTMKESTVVVDELRRTCFDELSKIGLEMVSVDVKIY